MSPVSVLMSMHVYVCAVSKKYFALCVWGGGSSCACVSICILLTIADSGPNRAYVMCYRNLSARTQEALQIPSKVMTW